MTIAAMTRWELFQGCLANFKVIIILNGGTPGLDFPATLILEQEVIFENLGNSVQRQTTTWPSISTLKTQAGVDAIFPEIKICMWEYIELRSHRLKCTYFVSSRRTRAGTARPPRDFQNVVTSPVSREPTRSCDTGGGDNIPILQVKEQISATLNNAVKVGKLVVTDFGEISVYFCLGIILHVVYF